VINDKSQDNVATRDAIVNNLLLKSTAESIYW